MKTLPLRNVAGFKYFRFADNSRTFYQKIDKRRYRKYCGSIDYGIETMTPVAARKVVEVFTFTEMCDVKHKRKLDDAEILSQTGAMAVEELKKVNPALAEQLRISVAHILEYRLL
jgi:hypothetical protein